MDVKLWGPRKLAAAKALVKVMDGTEWAVKWAVGLAAVAVTVWAVGSAIWKGRTGIVNLGEGAVGIAVWAITSAWEWGTTGAPLKISPFGWAVIFLSWRWYVTAKGKIADNVIAQLNEKLDGIQETLDAEKWNGDAP